MSKPPCSCGHPHSFHDTGWDAAGCMHRSCSCNAYREANKVVGDLALAGPMYEDHALREENARLRQRVEELERAPRCCADTIPPGCRTCRCADAAEARLAKVVKALSEYVSEDAAFAEDHLLCGGDCDWSARHKRARAALAAAKGE